MIYGKSRIMYCSPGPRSSAKSKYRWPDEEAVINKPSRFVAKFITTLTLPPGLSTDNFYSRGISSVIFLDEFTLEIIKVPRSLKVYL